MTLDQLKKRGWALANRCFFCGEEEENLEHIALHCPLVREVWSTLFALLEVNWVLPYSIRDLQHWWKRAVLK